ncbi:MAG: hypothetical protein HBSAPP04_23450 [Ignavibacteriaceae bacterium]|nr:MAG: hypothetical protein EDM75_08830 [Chlorobiota bacterium]GJQ33506.1 MAG: hypothetical protein HBSAPP04_23450 [Ignavibacteriaceae bacterium]
MITLTYILVSIVATMTIGFTILAATLRSRNTVNALDPANMQTLMSYTVIDNHGGYLDNYDDNESSDYENDRFEEDFNYHSQPVYQNDYAPGFAYQLTAVNHYQVKKPAYLHFR